MSDPASSNGDRKGRDAYRMMLGGGVTVLAALSLMVLNTVLDTQKAVVAMQVDVSGLKARVDADHSLVQMLIRRIYPTNGDH